MLLTKTITKSEDVQIEIKTPAFYGKSDTSKKIMLCDNGSLIIVYGEFINMVKNEPTSHYKYSLEDALKMDQISEDEFMNAYDAALKLYESAIFPEVVTGKKY